MRLRTNADNHQLAEGEVQIEDTVGAVSVSVLPTAPNLVRVCTVRGIRSRKAQWAFLSEEGVDALIEELQKAKAKLV